MWRIIISQVYCIFFVPEFVKTVLMTKSSFKRIHMEALYITYHGYAFFGSITTGICEHKTTRGAEVSPNVQFTYKGLILIYRLSVILSLRLTIFRKESTMSKFYLSPCMSVVLLYYKRMAGRVSLGTVHHAC